MAKLTLDDLRKMREQKQQQLEKRDPGNKDAQIIVGMGTCGIAAGAKETFGTIIEELDARGITNVLVRQTGCMGLCSHEPTVEVVVPDMPVVSYGDVNTEVAKQIVADHIVNKKLIDARILQKPSADIIG